MTFKFIPDKNVTVPDIPYNQEITVKADETALIIVDMQNDFIKKGGSLVVEAASQTIGGIQSLMENARSAGAKIVYTQDTAFPNDPEFDIWPPHCIKGSWGWEIIEELRPKENDLVCIKNRYDGFYGTWLDHFLSKIWGIRDVIIVGTVANICVLHTAASAGLRWYHVIMPADGISANTEFDQALTLRQASSLYNGSVLSSTKDIQFRITTG